MIDVPDWMADILANTSALQLIFWFVAIIALIAAIVKLWPVLTKTVTIINAVSGLPAFIKRTDDTLAGQDEKIGDIHHEVHFNNGTSVKDAVIRVEKGVAGLYDKVEDLNTADADLRADLEKTHPKNPLKE